MTGTRTHESTPTHAIVCTRRKTCAHAPPEGPLPAHLRVRAARQRPSRPPSSASTCPRHEASRPTAQSLCHATSVCTRMGTRAGHTRRAHAHSTARAQSLRRVVTCHCCLARALASAGTPARAHTAHRRGVSREPTLGTRGTSARCASRSCRDTMLSSERPESGMPASHAIHTHTRAVHEHALSRTQARTHARARTRTRTHTHAHTVNDLPHPCRLLHQAHPCHICAGTGLTPATSALGLGSPLPHLHREWAVT